jgi:hypothetical protein
MTVREQEAKRKAGAEVLEQFTQALTKDLRAIQDQVTVPGELSVKRVNRDGHLHRVHVDFHLEITADALRKRAN